MSIHPRVPDITDPELFCLLRQAVLFGRTHPSHEPTVVTAATTTALNTTELLEAILVHLPLQELYRAQRVCRQWYLCIDNSVAIKQRLWFQPSNEKFWPERVQFEGLWTRPLSVNPLLEREVWLPKKGGWRNSAVLLPWARDGDTKANKGGVVVENLLETETVKVDKSTLTSVKTNKTKASAPQPPPTLTETNERPMHTTFIPLQPFAAELPNQPNNLGQIAWKHVHLTSPPIHEFMIKPVGVLKMVHFPLKTDQPVLLWHVLMGVEICMMQWPEEVRSAVKESRLEFEVLLPLQRADGGNAEGVGGDGVWRALKTRVKCRVEEEERACWAMEGLMKEL